MEMNFRAMGVQSGLALAAVLSSCAGAGTYGHAREYVPLRDEVSWQAQATEPVYDEVRRMPGQYVHGVISWFGVVTSVQEGNPAQVALQLRTPQQRNLCEDESDTSCRVTVSQRDGGAFTARLTLRPEDTQGENRVQPNSLLRVYGTLVEGEYDPSGGPVLQVRYYRQWPRGEYVTTAAAGSWRR